MAAIYSCRSERGAYSTDKSGTVCSRCKGPKEPGYRLCAVCREVTRKKVAQLREARLSLGLCTTCGKVPHLSGTWYCSFHIVWNRIAQCVYGGVDPLAKAMWRKWEEQGGRCSVTGWEIDLLTTAQIDHIVSQKNGGLTIPENMHWVHVTVNLAKGDMNLDDFLISEKGKLLLASSRPD